MSLQLVTLDPDDGTYAGHRTIYSAVVTFKTFHKYAVDSYVTSYVGICGQSRVASCAESVVSGIDQEATKLRSVFGALMNNGASAN